MKKKTNKDQQENYLERKPKRHEAIAWAKDKPKVTHIHLDEMGSFVWPIMDGEKDIIAIGKEVEGQFGEKANPLYERLAKFFQVLDSYHFITWN